MFAKLKRYRNLAATNNVMRRTKIIYLGIFEHHMIEHFAIRWHAKGNGVLAVITMHENRFDYATWCAEVIFDRARKAEYPVKVIAFANVRRSNQAMAKSCVFCDKAPMHTATRVEWQM